MPSFKRWFKVEDPSLSEIIDRPITGDSKIAKHFGASLAVIGIVAAFGIAPLALSSTVNFDYQDPEVQEHAIAAVETNTHGRDNYKVVRIPTYSSIVSALSDPSSPQSYAYSLVESRGWSVSEFSCLYNLWNRESRWRVDAENKSSGAYGIPQALPGSKMKSAGDDWRTNFKTQIDWGIKYIKGRYGTPCGAWDHSERKGWY